MRAQSHPRSQQAMTLRLTPSTAALPPHRKALQKSGRSRRSSSQSRHHAHQPHEALADSAHDPFPRFGIDQGHGFLPPTEPLTSMLAGHPELAAWDRAVEDIPKLCLISGSGALRRELLQLPPFPLPLLRAMGPGQLWRAYQSLSFLAHAFLWCERDGGPVPSVLPARLAVPWAAASQAVQMPPVLVYSTYNLLNWRRVDPAGAVELGNIVCLNNFLGGQDEEHFRLVHVDIEAKAAPALAGLTAMQEAVEKGDNDSVEKGLQSIALSLRLMQATLSRMGEKCDPYIYYHRVRLPMSGWKGNPALPTGLVYEGVSPEPQELYGETGAQSSIVPALDAVLGIGHDEDWLKAYLEAMVAHMPPAHRSFLSELRGARFARCPGGVRGLCSRAPLSPGGLREAYNDAVLELEKFRSQHKAFAFQYIAKFSREEKGTGGSDFMPALGGYRDTTSKHLI